MNDARETLRNIFQASELRWMQQQREDAHDILILVEWSGYRDYVGDGGYRCCPICGGLDPTEESRSRDALHDLHHGLTTNGHAVTCRLDDALTRAGWTGAARIFRRLKIKLSP